MQSIRQPLQTLQDIKRMMERSSRFISLSGWSGISAGICALAGAWVAVKRIEQFKKEQVNYFDKTGVHLSGARLEILVPQLINIAIVVFLAALISAFLFTYFRSKKAGIGIWSNTAMRLMWNTSIPMIAGGLVIIRMLDLKYYLLVAPCCLIFYGLALVNGSKYTLGEVRYLGYGQIILGLINLWILGYGLIFWAAGFGVLHIVYGTMMWWKYER
jgi:hypothetical protein